MRSLKRKISGFTMIELLIVIAVLGVLAVAVLAAINPIEQINRGKDTGSRSDSEQLLSAIDRFYAAETYYPWQTGSTDTEHIPTEWGPVDDSWADNGGTTVLSKLSSGGTAEIKESFVNRITSSTYNTLYKYHRGQVGDSVYICFSPKSASFRTEANTRAGTSCDGLPEDLAAAGCDNLCPTIGGATTCYVCLP